MKFILTAVFALCLSVAQAVEHGMGDIKGNSIELKTYDHAIAGEVNGKLIFGNVNEEEGYSELNIKYEGTLSKTIFSKEEGKKFGGTISFTTEKGDHQMIVEFVKLDRSTNTYTFSFNGKLLNIQVTAPEFKNNHFINPTYTTILEDGKMIRFTMSNGQACYNFSAHLITMIVSSYLVQ